MKRFVILLILLAGFNLALAQGDQQKALTVIISGLGSVTVTAASQPGSSFQPSALAPRPVTAQYRFPWYKRFFDFLFKSKVPAFSLSSMEPPKICPPDSTCLVYYDQNTPITLTATAPSDGQFTGWSGACSGTGFCMVTMDSNKTVTASFDSLATPSLPVTMPPSMGGGGMVSQSPIQIMFAPIVYAFFNNPDNTGLLSQEEVYTALQIPYNLSTLAGKFFGPSNVSEDAYGHFREALDLSQNKIPTKVIALLQKNTNSKLTGFIGTIVGHLTNAITTPEQFVKEAGDVEGALDALVAINDHPESSQVKGQIYSLVDGFKNHLVSALIQPNPYDYLDALHSMSEKLKKLLASLNVEDQSEIQKEVAIPVVISPLVEIASPVNEKPEPTTPALSVRQARESLLSKIRGDENKARAIKITKINKEGFLRAINASIKFFQDVRERLWR